jgi:hypothetical protein
MSLVNDLFLRLRGGAEREQLVNELTGWLAEFDRNDRMGRLLTMERGRDRGKLLRRLAHLGASQQEIVERIHAHWDADREREAAMAFGRKETSGLSLSPLEDVAPTVTVDASRHELER